MRITAWIAAMRRGFNLWLLLGIFFCAGTALVVVNAVLMVDFARGHLKHVCTTAREAYEEGGSDALSLVLRGVGAGTGIRVHLMDSAGRDLTDGQHRSSLTAAAKAAPSPAGAPLPMMVKTNQYVCVIEPPARIPSIPLGPSFWVLPFVSILCCSVGAYVTWRMRRIEAVVRHFGSGELAARMPSDSKDAIGRLARAFNQMAERIESLVASHQRLCADMAHELRSPLARLLLAVRGARGGAAGSLDRAEAEASRINDLISQLLDVARAEVDPAALELACVDLESLLTEIADHCRIEAAERRCEIELVFSKPGYVTADEELLRRAIENVLRNAIQHTQEGIRVQLFGGGGQHEALIAVRDWGPGVPDQALAGIFQPFYRVDAAQGRSNGGVGLGLSIAQRAIAVHRGTIFAENCAPGLRVTIRIPRD